MSYGGIDCKMWLSNILCKIYYIGALFLAVGSSGSIPLPKCWIKTYQLPSARTFGGGGGVMFSALHRRPQKRPHSEPEEAPPRGRRAVV